MNTLYVRKLKNIFKHAKIIKWKPICTVLSSEKATRQLALLLGPYLRCYHKHSCLIWNEVLVQNPWCALVSNSGPLVTSPMLLPLCHGSITYIRGINCCLISIQHYASCTLGETGYWCNHKNGPDSKIGRLVHRNLKGWTSWSAPQHPILQNFGIKFKIKTD